MKNIYRRKIGKIVMVVVIVAISLLMHPNNQLLATSSDDIQVSFVEHPNEDFTQTIVEFQAKGATENIEVLSITMPDGTSVDGANAQYKADTNGKQQFIVHYSKTKGDAKTSIPLGDTLQFTSTYEVSSIKEKGGNIELSDRSDSTKDKAETTNTTKDEVKPEPIIVKHESVYSEVDKSYIVTATAIAQNEKTTITSVELPDGTQVESASAGYKTSKTEDLTFKVNYEDEASLDKEITSIYKFSTSSIRSVDKVDVDARGVPYTPEDWFDFDTKTGTITRLKNVKYWDVGWASNPAFPAINYTNGDINIPPTIKGVTVKEIGAYAFFNSYESQRIVVNSITFPDTISAVRNYGAFGIYILSDQNLKLPEGLKTLEIGAFGGLHCKGITFPTALKFQGIYTAFQTLELDNGNGTLEIPEGITHIGDNAFMYSNFKKVIFPKSFTSGGSNLFARTSIREADFSKSTNLTSIPESMFANSALKNLDLSACTKMTYIEKSAFNANQLESVILPNSINDIRESAFYNNKIKTVNLQDTNIQVIGTAAFAVNQLEKVSFPISIRDIGGRAFSNNKLKELDISKIKGTSESSPLYLGPAAFGRENKLFYLDFEDIYVTTKGSERELVYDAATFQWIYKDIVGNVLSGNNVNGVAYVDIKGDNIVPIDTLFPGIKTERFSINNDRTLGFLTNLGLDITNPAVIAEYMPVYNPTTGYIKLPSREVLNRKIIVGGVEKVVKDVYGFVYEYIVASNFVDVDGKLTYSDGGSYITVSEFILGVKVTYHSNDGAKERVWESAALEGQVLKAKPSEPTRAGYTFAGWYTTPTINPANKWNYDTSLVGKTDFDLYAGWELKKEKVTFDANGGAFTTGTTKSLEVVSNTAIGAAMSELPILSGFTFEGWNTSADGTGKMWNLTTDLVSGSTTLYAKWKFDTTVQNPVVLLDIPKKIELKDDIDRQNASAIGEIKTITGYPYEPWLSDSVIEIKADTAITLRNVANSDVYKLVIKKSDGSVYADATQSLISLNMKGIGYPTSDTFKLLTSIKEIKNQGIYEGTMTFYISIK